MPSGLKQPIGQKRLTNVAIVRLRKAGCVFEIACYKNKVSNWRAQIETDLDEVLQTTAVFSNVSKGIMAKETNLQKGFGMTDEERICLEILDKGELQVSEKERKLEYDNMFKDVASILAEKCLDPQTQRQYTATIIERALKDVHFNPDLKKSAKQQALIEALPMLQERFSIQRAQMKVQLHVPLVHGQSVKKMIDDKEISINVTHQDENASVILFDCLVDPGIYRSLHQALEDATEGTGRIELMNLAAATHEISVAPAPASPRTDGEMVAADVTRQRVGSKIKQEKAGVARVVYPRGSISGLGVDFARRDMFLEIDSFEQGWEVELLQFKGSNVIKAEFYAPTGEIIGPFAKARRQALTTHKKHSMKNAS